MYSYALLETEKKDETWTSAEALTQSVHEPKSSFALPWSTSTYLDYCRQYAELLYNLITPYKLDSIRSESEGLNLSSRKYLGFGWHFDPVKAQLTKNSDALSWSVYHAVWWHIVAMVMKAS